MNHAPQISSVDISHPHNRWKIHAVLLITVGMTVSGISIVNVALPTIQADFNAAESSLQWVLVGYALVFGITLIPAGRLGDLYESTWLYISGIIIFAGASVFAGFASDIQMLNSARLVQGFGSGILSPQIMGIIQRNFTGPERGRAMGAYGAVVAASMGSAPVIGGILIDLTPGDSGWRWTFLVNVPICVAAITLALIWFPKRSEKIKSGHVRAPKNLDLVGSFLLAISILVFLAPFTVLDWLYLWLCLPSSLLLLVIWVFWEKKYKSSGKKPMIDLSLFDNSSFSSGVTVSSVYFLGITAVWVVVAMYLQLGEGVSALNAGLVGLPSAILGVLSSRWAGNHVFYLGRKIISIGIILAITALFSSMLMVNLVSAGYLSFWWLALTLSLVGVAQGFVINPNQTLTLNGVPFDYAGSSGGVLQTGQRLGSAVGVAIVTAVTFKLLPSSGWNLAVSSAFMLIILFLSMALLFSVREQRNETKSLNR